ncbi:MAG: hypothetical protein JWO16_1524 [Sphingomonas bacterium]|nr:hypothetical protein [Sphingomonas bacterium]
MVGVARIELATPAMSTQCSTTELHAHEGAASNEAMGGLQPPAGGFRFEQAIDLHHQVAQVERL